MRRAGIDERLLVTEAAIDGGPLDASALGDRADGRSRRSDRSLESDVDASVAAEPPAALAVSYERASPAAVPDYRNARQEQCGYAVLYG